MGRHFLLLFLEHFELLGRGSDILGLLSFENFHHSELFISNPQDADFPLFRKKSLYALNMNIRLLMAHAVAQVDGELEHAKSVVQQLFPEAGIDPAIGILLSGKIEKDHYPHNSVFIESHTGRNL